MRISDWSSDVCSSDLRIVMAPLTRGRAGPGFVPNELAREYYRQRASAGLIISEATGISQEGLGWPSAPGLWTDAQVEGWKPVTDAVHEAGGRIVEIGRAHVGTPGTKAHLVCRHLLEKKK